MFNRLYQNHRVRILIIYGGGLVAINFLLFDELLPSGLWFWSAFLSFLLSALLSQPYFTAPRDAIANSLAVIGVVVATLSAESLDEIQVSVWRISVIATFIVLTISIAAMALRDSDTHKERVYAQMATYIARLFGSPRVLFSSLFFLVLFTFHSDSVSEVFWLSLTWVVIVVGRPLEHLYNLYTRLKELGQEGQVDAHVIGHVEFRRDPGLIAINIVGEGIPDIDSLVVIPTDETHGQLGLILDNYRLADGQWCSALVFADRVPRADLDCGWGLPNTVLRCDKAQIKNSDWLKSEKWSNKDKLVGAVIEGSDIHRARIELYKDNVELNEGQLLSININNTDVLYQIVNGITRSELLEESNKHGFMSIEARKLGNWNKKIQRFDAVPWTPNVYAPVFSAGTKEPPSFHQDYIGYIPNTDCGIKIDSDKLVTHNTAILGVLGSGKTSLALELIRRMVNDGIKVWVIDITGQYEPALGQLVHKAKQQTADTTIEKDISCSAEKVQENKDLGGNHRVFAESIAKHVVAFMKDDMWRLRVFNPGKYRITEQTSGMYNQKAGIGDLTPTQTTRIVSEELLKYFGEDMSEKARLCLVLEEAHSLVPEWNSVTYEGDKQATNGTARAILQGRKYGFGCLLVTQRTANVTKSILNQCNTIFGLKVFDATGMDFLSNYIGTDYAGILATLPERQCVAFGSALKRPVSFDNGTERPRDI